MNITRVHERKTEATYHLIIQAIEAGEATAQEYDIEAIADVVLDRDEHGRWGFADDYVDENGQGGAEAFWDVVADHQRGAKR